jgi:hypothetical protein
MPNPNPMLEKIHFLLYPEDEKKILKHRSQKKPVLCRIPLTGFHKWSENKNGIRYCLKCGKIDFNFMITRILTG